MLDFRFLDNGKFNVARLQCAEEKRLWLPSDAKRKDAALIRKSPPIPESTSQDVRTLLKTFDVNNSENNQT
ncbi:hypothetical protein WJU16_13815 [Chitinophaga pollutisoli]|uniref:Uncharacterized protein n=1 Tax=Chitinophaga pollutisoli TaxID=3133966 RepID=A0ABZ2YIT6_9BACT